MVGNKIYRGHVLRIAVGIAMLGLLLAGSAGAATLTVNASGGANYTRIQDAINNASAGDTILVYSGTYYENVNVNKQLTLRGVDKGAGKPVVDASRSGSAITLSAANITLEGFKAVNDSRMWQSAGIYVMYPSNSNKIKNNTASNNGEGILLLSSNNNTLSNNNVSNNFFNGTYLFSSNDNTLSNNIANSNGYNGISLFGSSRNMLIDDITSNNNYNGIVLLNSEFDTNYHSINNILLGNTAYSNKIYGIYLSLSSNTTVTNNIAISNYGEGINFTYSNGNTLMNNTASLNFRGIGLDSSSNNTLTSNNVSSNNYQGMVLYASGNNSIYNNYFNNTNNFVPWDTNYNLWNTAKTPGTNIIGGPYLGGNFWAHPNGTGFSQTCPDADRDGICDSTYALDANNTDFLPLSDVAQLSNSGGGIWQYSKDSTILNSGAALTDYQVLVNLTGASFPTGANMSGADIRFTDAGGSELAYWIESWDYANRSGKLWVNVTSIPAGASSMRMWYGNPSAGSSSNGDTTFEFYDDFDDNSLDNVKWSQYCRKGVPYQPLQDVTCLNRIIEQNKVLEMNLVSDGGTNSESNLISNKYFTEGFAIKYDFKNGDSWNYLYKHQQLINSTNVSTWGDWNSIGWGWMDWGPLTFSGNENGIMTINTTQSYVNYDNFWFTGEFIYYKNKTVKGIMTRYDGVSYGNVFNKTFTVEPPRYLLLDAVLWFGGSPGRIYYDNVTLRKYRDPEPSVSFASYNMTGRVLNSSSGLGIPGALVKLDDFPQYNATTNITGDYSMSVPAGTYNVSASATEYATNTATVAVNADTVQDFALNFLQRVHNINKGTNYSTIQSAIDDASPGNEIHVDSGTYYENVNVSKQLILRGIDNGGGMPVVDGAGNNAITLNAGGITLEGFVAENASSFAGILVTSNDNILRNNIASNNNNGIFLTSVTIGANNNNTLDNNSANSNSFGIAIEFSGNNVLKDNTANSNLFGIVIFDSKKNNLTNNIVYSNSIGILIQDFISPTINNTLTNNTIKSNDYGIKIYSSLHSSSGNLIYNNYFNNTNNAYDNGNNIWSITKKLGTNIIGGSYLGGNYWSDYAGNDTDGDGLGNTLFPYNSSGNITNGGDILPLTIALKQKFSISGFKINSSSGNGIAGWNITLSNASLTVTSSTNGTGFYNFSGLVDGTYNVTEETKPGFTNVSATSVMVTITDHDIMNLNFTNMPVTPSPSISIVPPSTTANQSDTFSVNVTVDPAGNQVKGVEINLKFNQTVVQLNSVVIGNFLGNSPQQFLNSIDNTNGTLKLAHIVAGGNQAVMSPGTYATLNFKVNSNAPAGTSALNLTRAILSNDTGANIPGITRNNGTITVNPASISIVPPSTTGLNHNDTFSVNVTVDPAGNQVKGVEINLKFNQTVVQLNSVVIGNFLGSSPLQFQNQIDNTNGVLKLAHTVQVSGSAVTAPGTYATLNFKINSAAPAGTSTLGLTTAILSNDFGANIAGVMVNNGTITVNPPSSCILPNGKNLDLNHDGSIGIGDAVVLINHWDAQDGPADLNNDGTVGIGDAVVLINNWDKSC